MSANGGWAQRQVWLRTRKRVLGWAHPDAPGLVVHRALGGRRAAWTLSHVDSGQAVCHFNSKRRAMRAALAIAPLTDWTQPDNIVCANVERLAVSRAIERAGRSEVAS